MASTNLSKVEPLYLILTPGSMLIVSVIASARTSMLLTPAKAMVLKPISMALSRILNPRNAASKFSAASIRKLNTFAATSSMPPMSLMI